MMLGLGLTPLGWVTLIGFTALGNVLGVDGDTIARDPQPAGNDAHRAAILDTACSARAAQSPAHDPLVVTLQALLVAGTIHEVGDLADAAGVDRRLHSKRLLRRQRFLRTLAAIRDRLDEPLMR